MDGKPVSFSEWFKKGNISIKDLLDEKGNFIIFDEFFRKFSCKTNFLKYYQLISIIPKHLLIIAKQSDTFDKSSLTSSDKIFSLNETAQNRGLKFSNH